jgi:hypothetical protein
MEHFVQLFFPYLMTVLGVVILIMLKSLLKTHSLNSDEISQLRKDFNDLLLKIANLTPTFMNIPMCNEVRRGCVELNKEIILKPLQKQLDSYINENNQKWNEYENETEQFWISLKNHAHSDQGVVVSPRKN